LLQDAPPSPVSLAAALATLVDRRVRVGRETIGPDGDVLIWLEQSMPGSEPVASGARGVIVVMHGADQAAAARSFVVSFPIEAGGKGRQLGAVSDLMGALGWSLLASDRRKTDLGQVDTAVFVNTNGFEGEQRLWLAEPVEATPKASRATGQHSTRPIDWSDAGSNPTARSDILAMARSTTPILR
jgi:hypothetical protein